MGIYYLWLYVLLNVATCVSAFVGRNSFIYKLMWLEYTVIAVCTLLCVLFQTELLGHAGSLDYWYSLDRTSLQGYLLLFVCTWLALRPLASFGGGCELATFGRSEAEKQLFLAFTILYLLAAAAFVALSMSSVRAALSTSDYGSLRSDLYSGSDNESSLVLTTNPIASLAFKLCNLFKYIGIVIAFGMLKEKHHPVLAVVLIFTIFGIYYIYASANAARGGLMVFCFCAVILASLLYGFLSPGYRKRIMVGACVLGFLVFSIVAAITISRFANDGGGGNAIVRNVMFYLGHAPIEFSTITGSVSKYGGGEVILGRLFAHWFGSPYSWEAVSFTIGFPQFGPLFITYLGYIFADFGYIGCLLFAMVWAAFLSALLKNSPGRLSTLVLLGYYISFYATGAFTLGRLEFASLVTFHAIWLFLRLWEEILDRPVKNYPNSDIKGGALHAWDKD